MILSPPVTTPEPSRTDTLGEGVLSHSASVAGWTAASRATGLVKIVMVGAVLGPTYFGNLFQTANQLPNLLVELLVGAIFASLLVPPLVERLDRGERTAGEALACSFLGAILVVLTLVALATILLGPLLLRVFTSGVADPTVASAQRSVGWPLI